MDAARQLALKACSWGHHHFGVKKVTEGEERMEARALGWEK
jgi:hypothetical protein